MLSSSQRADEIEFNPYEILDVGRDFSELELRTKYKQAVRRSHPDRGGTDLEMANVSKAYEILTDPKKRKLYDQFGARALQLISRPNFGKRPGSLYEHIRSGAARQNVRRGQPRQDRERSRSPRKASQTANLKTIMPIKLAEAYKGRKKSMRFRLEHDCTRCSTRENICRFCNGEGRYITVGENIAQSWKDCEHCHGTGKKSKYCSDCVRCHGKGKFYTKKTLDVVIEPGVPDRQVIVMKTKEAIAAITLRIRKHRKFKRVGDDLFLTKQISIKESLFGTSFQVKTLDDRALTLKSPKFKTINPSQPYCVENEGMPIFRGNGRKGKLYIKFVVDFKLEAGDREAFERLNKMMKVPSRVSLKVNSLPLDYSSDECGETASYFPVKSEIVSLGDKKNAEIAASSKSIPALYITC